MLRRQFNKLFAFLPAFLLGDQAEAKRAASIGNVHVGGRYEDETVDLADGLWSECEFVRCDLVGNGFVIDRSVLDNCTMDDKDIIGEEMPWPVDGPSPGLCHNSVIVRDGFESDYEFVNIAAFAVENPYMNIDEHDSGWLTADTFNGKSSVDGLRISSTPIR